MAGATSMPYMHSLIQDSPTAEGSAAEDSTAEDSAAEGSTAEGSAVEDSTVEGSTAEAATSVVVVDNQRAVTLDRPEHPEGLQSTPG